MLDRYGYEEGGLTSIRAGYKNGKKANWMRLDKNNKPVSYTHLTLPTTPYV